jgi:REase_MTES_1575/Transcriptional regulator, AbiEi antitoxin
MGADQDRAARTARLSRGQQGAARPDQLIALGWSPSEIKTRVRRGEWHRRHRGVVILGDPELLPLAHPAAALLALGKRASVSYRSGTALSELCDPPSDGVVDLSLSATSARPREGVRIHLVGPLDAKDRGERFGLRVTSPARTVIDFAVVASSSELEHATGEAVARRLMHDDELTAALDRAPQNHPGAARLSARLMIDPDLLLHTQSVAERLASPLIIDAGLPRPLLNQYLEGLKVDLHWPEHRLIVEVDGYQFHVSRQAFEEDRRRDQILTAAGYTVIRITWLQLTNEPYRVIAAIAQALGRAALAA